MKTPACRKGHSIPGPGGRLWCLAKDQGLAFVVGMNFAWRGCCWVKSGHEVCRQVTKIRQELAAASF